MLTPGQTIGRFEVRAPVGQGGMGAVYVGFDPSLGRQVALKVMHEDLTKDPVAVERFRREALALAKLAHPSVVRIYDLVESEGHLVLVMEHLAGQSLRQRMGAGRMDASEAVNLARELLAALDAAHGVGVLHRDLKPANVFVTARGEAKLLDFGVARLADATRLTETGELLGTVRYMAPELLRGEEPSARSDLYAVGFILFEMLAERPPYEGTGIDLVIQIRSGKPPRLGDVAPQVPADVAQAVDRALAADPSARFESADTFLRALPARPSDPRTPSAAALATRTLADSPHETSRAERPRPRRAWPIAAAVVALAVVGVAGAGVLAKATAPAGRRALELRALAVPSALADPPPSPSDDPSPAPSGTELSTAPPPSSSAPPSALLAASSGRRAAPPRIQILHRYTGTELGPKNDRVAADQTVKAILARGPALRQCVEHASPHLDRVEIELREERPVRCEYRVVGDFHYFPFPCCQAAVADLTLTGGVQRVEVALDVKRTP